MCENFTEFCMRLLKQIKYRKSFDLIRKNCILKNIENKKIKQCPCVRIFVYYFYAAQACRIFARRLPPPRAAA